MTTLSHYTSRAGLEGICRTGTLWATNFLTVNDRTEFFYTWKMLQRAAFEYALQRIPEEHRAHDFDMDKIVEGVLAEFRSALAAGDGFGHLFITSFALSRNEEEDRRGILTLWHRYTNLDGYCIQYDKADIEKMLRLDAMKSSYEWLELLEVNYGVKKDTPSFRELSRQIGEQQLLQYARETRDWRVNPDYKNNWAPTYLAMRLASYCGTHKDPAFSDEREFRIIAYPHKNPHAQFLTGVSSPKTIRNGPGGKRYIVIGDNWTPPIRPTRIIIGLKADRNIDDILRHFDKPPVVDICDIPIVA